jgi:hypothetical protein
MKTIDEVWRETLDLLELPNSPGLFILGSFAQRVTVYSQQVRSLNLVDALAGLGYLHQGSSIAVIGAGFAGTTTAAALVKMGVSVSLFDARTVPMHLQLNCATRYLHPHIYDWPLKDIDEIDAALPILNWQAKYSQKLAEEIRHSWEEIRNAAPPERVTVCFGKPVTNVSLEQHQWFVEVDHEKRPQAFDIIVLAVGFGVEDDNSNSYSYWADIPLAEQTINDHTWMISGAGDGALTDVIRLCIRHRDHEKALRDIIAAVQGQQHEGKEFLAILRERVEQGILGEELFDNLNPRSIVAQLNVRETPVILNATVESIFGTNKKPPRSSTLNRLATWVMWKVGKITLVNGAIAKENPVSGQRGSFKVKLEGGATPLVQCQELLLRHGPQPVLLPKSSGGNWLGKQHKKHLDRLNRKWQELYNKGRPDPTLLKKEWAPNAFAATRLPADTTRQPAVLLYSDQGVGGDNASLSLKKYC